MTPKIPSLTKIICIGLNTPHSFTTMSIMDCSAPLRSVRSTAIISSKDSFNSLWSLVKGTRTSHVDEKVIMDTYSKGNTFSRYVKNVNNPFLANDKRVSDVSFGIGLFIDRDLSTNITEGISTPACGRLVPLEWHETIHIIPLKSRDTLLSV